jgi:hypothetical protein
MGLERAFYITTGFTRRYQYVAPNGAFSFTFNLSFAKYKTTLLPKNSTPNQFVKDN